MKISNYSEVQKVTSVPVSLSKQYVSHKTSSRSELLNWVSFFVLVLLISGNVVAVRFTNRELPPFWGAGIRFAIAAIPFFIFMMIRRVSLPRGRGLLGAILFGMFQFGFGYALAYYALEKVPAGLASVILASVPLFTLFFAFVMRLEKLRIRSIIGSLVALVGITVMFGASAGKEIPFAYLLAITGTAVCFAIAPVIVKLSPQVHPASMNAVGMATGSIMLLGISFFHGEGVVFPKDLVTWTALVYLIIPGTIGLFLLFLNLLKRWKASTVSYQTVLSPIGVVALSAWLLGESLTGGLLLGSVLVIVGVYIGALAADRQTKSILKPEG
jgi:drug/metabolite transporter (DMT)-like permease